MGEGVYATFSSAVREAVVSYLEDDDVTVITEQPLHSLGLSATEVFIQINARNQVDADALTSFTAQKIEAGDFKNRLKHPININVIPVEWHFALGAE